MNSARIIRRLDLLEKAHRQPVHQCIVAWADPAYREAIDWVLPDLTLIGPAAGDELRTRIYGEAVAK